MKTTLLLICLFFAASGQAQEYEKPRKWKVELTGVPALQFASPALKLGKDKDRGLSFIVSPRLTIPLFPNQTLDIQYVPNNPGVWAQEKVLNI